MYDQEQIKQLVEMKESLGVQIDHFGKTNINPNITNLIQRKLVKMASLKQVTEIKTDLDCDNFELQAQALDNIPNNLYAEYESFEHKSRKIQVHLLKPPSGKPIVGKLATKLSREL